MADPTITPELGDLAFFALDHAIRSVEGGNTLVPFAVTGPSDRRHLVRFAAETLEGGIERATSHAQQQLEAGLRCAIAWDGYLTPPGSQRMDAVYVEAVEPGSPSIVLAQRYVPKGRFGKFQTVGNPALFPEAPRRLIGD